MRPIPYSFRQIDYVLAVAETGSTAAAARALHVSQPSVSVAIAQFEDHFGAALFLRLPGQGMRLTPFGRERIAQMRALRSQAAALFGDAHDQPQELRLGVYSTLGPRYAPMLMRNFGERQPGAKVSLVEADIASLTRATLTGELDLGLVYDVGLPPDLDVTRLVDVPPHAVLPPGHPLEGRDEVTLHELALEPLIVVGLPHSRGYFLSLFQIAGEHPRIAAEAGSVEMLRALVANGHGVGILATDIPHDRTYDGRRVVRRRIAGDLPPSRVVLIRARRFEATQTMKEFTELARGLVGTERRDTAPATYDVNCRRSAQD